MLEEFSNNSNSSPLDDEMARLSEFHNGYPDLVDDPNKIAKFKKLAEFFRIRDFNCAESKLFSGVFCNASDDYFACYPATKANTTLYQDCPYRNSFNTEGNSDASKLKPIWIN